ncbi:MAG: hypothetical protein JWP45_1039, partial [Mucilaginibacter sp.]|nr:hypothetical protein [Mucilaginibacter sp.]
MAQKPLKPTTPVKTPRAAWPAAKPTDARHVQFIFDRGNYRLL